MLLTRVSRARAWHGESDSVPGFVLQGVMQRLHDLARDDDEDFSPLVFGTLGLRGRALFVQWHVMVMILSRQYYHYYDKRARTMAMTMTLSYLL